MKRGQAFIAALLLSACLCACGLAEETQHPPETSAQQSQSADAEKAGAAETAEEPAAESGNSAQPEAAAPAEIDAQSAAPAFDRNTRIWDVIEDPAFEGFGRLLFPEFDIPPARPLKEVYALLPSYHNISADKTVEVLNAMKAWAEEGRQIFFDIYSSEEKAADPAKEATGLFFFPGEPGGKLAIYSPGQAFKYIGAIHDGFPHALELSRRGYNTFVLIYRPGSVTGCEDLARAISFVMNNAEQLQVDTTDYSLWGGASGGRLTTWICEHGTAAFGAPACPKPAAMIMQYCAVWDVSVEDVPTYVNVGKRDTFTIVNVPARAAKLAALGIDTELEIFEDCAHGFGLGLGTSAEGWLDRAVSFWERHMTA